MKHKILFMVSTSFFLAAYASHNTNYHDDDFDWNLGNSYVETESSDDLNGVDSDDLNGNSDSGTDDDLEGSNDSDDHDDDSSSDSDSHDDDSSSDSDDDKD